MNTAIFNGKASMTSVEIAELVGKRHDNVKRTIETLAKGGVVRSPQIEVSERINNLGFKVQYEHYLFEGEQGNRREADEEPEDDVLMQKAAGLAGGVRFVPDGNEVIPTSPDVADMTEDDVMLMTVSEGIAGGVRYG